MNHKYSTFCLFLFEIVRRSVADPDLELAGGSLTLPAFLSFTILLLIFF